MITFTDTFVTKFILIGLFLMSILQDYSQNLSPIKFGDFLVTPIEIATIKTKLKKGELLEPVNIFLVQTAGKNILIDAGIDSSWNSYKQSHWKTRLFFKNFSVTNKTNIHEVLNKMGLSVDSINVLILTHAHFDHIYGLPAFKNTRIIMSKKERSAFRWGLLNGYLKINAGQIKKADKIKFVRDTTLKDSFQQSYTFLPGFKLVPTYGHTKGHTSVLLNNNAEYILFTGDYKTGNKFTMHPDVLKFQKAHNVRLLFNHMIVSE